MSGAEAGEQQPGPALIITGMHRSGTSLTAALFQSAGLFLGNRLMPGNWGNERGHFEDLDVVGFHQRSLFANGLLSTGFDISTAVLPVPDSEKDIVQSLVTERRGLGVAWGWKDPRGVLFLPFWAAAVPEARFLLVFRRPWEVVDSLFRRNSELDQVFRTDVLRSLDLWCHYNTLIRDFARTHADRVVVREIGQIIASPAAVIEDIGRTFGIALGVPEPLFEPGKLTTGPAAVRECLVALAAPQSRDLYAELCSLAGLPEAYEGGPEVPGVRAACERAFAEWARESDAARPPVVPVQ